MAFSPLNAVTAALPLNILAGDLKHWKIQIKIFSIIFGLISNFLIHCPAISVVLVRFDPTDSDDGVRFDW